MKEIYDAKKDPQFSKGFIDIDEMRTRTLDDGRELPYRYMHGGFEGTDVKFSFCFPEKEAYEGRFYQYLSPFPGPDEELASLPVTGEDDKVAFCLTHGAYYVESNMGSKMIFTNSDDNTMTHRSSAASAEYSRVMAQKVYGYEHRPYGYVYGGSGGGYRTIACIENTNAFDGGVPYVIGSPYAIPNCQTTRAYAERILRHKIPQIMDAMDAGGSGDPYEGLNEEEAAALKEATLFGYPLKSWFCSADLNDGSLPVLMSGIKGMDPQYFEDYWNVPGYLGADPNSSAVKDRICMDAKIAYINVPGLKEQIQEGKIDTRNGVDDAWKKMITSDEMDDEPWIELQDVLPEKDYYVKGAVMTFLTGAAKGKHLQIGRIEGNRVYLTEGFGMDSIVETLQLLAKDDTIHMDNSDYVAVQTYHRHQVPTKDYHAWDQFRNEDGDPLYPQQKMLLGPNFCGNGPGCKEDGLIQAKVIIVAALMDEQAYPWQADWYRRKIASVHDGNDTDYCRLWYFDHALHGDTAESVDERRVVTYLSGLKQALVDLAAWVEKGKEPLPSSNYHVNVGSVEVADSADERGGIQPVVYVTANGSKCAHVKTGESVQFTAEAEVPKGAGALTDAEWSFEGETDFTYKGEFYLSNGGKCGTAKAEHIFKEPGTYFVVVHVKSQRDGDKSDLFTQIKNLDRVRVVVE